MVLERLFSVGGDMIAQGGTELDLMADATGHRARRAEARPRHGLRRDENRHHRLRPFRPPRRTAPRHGPPPRAATGEPVHRRIGCHLGGYHAESGVTLVVGGISAEQARVMQAMADANAACIAALSARAPCQQVNEGALAPIRAAGLSDAIRHRIGHGMGVEGHEAPWLSPGDPRPPRPAWSSPASPASTALTATAGAPSRR